ncbi:MAG: DUF2851 family protein [Bacteroidia bacterium]|nr:DUF2851 family protein [Bacteroidia bacterium]
MKEEFLHYIWKNLLYEKKTIVAFTGEKIEIIEPGQLNTDAGPDFFNAKIKINDTVWAGNIEIHIRSSDWKKHKHHLEKGYNNVILHIVHEYDQDIFRTNGEKIPTIKMLFNPKLFKRYTKLMEAESWLLCREQIVNVDKFIISQCLSSLLIERLIDKTDSIIQSLELNKYNWDESFYIHLARNFGFKLNALPFELLAKSLSLKILARHRDVPFQIDAMLYGQAGMLTGDIQGDKHYTGLKKEYELLKNKYSLQPIEKFLWKFMRIRPVNFPTVRIAQFSSLIQRADNLFSTIIELNNVKEIYELFNVIATGYWESHYDFVRESISHIKRLGKDAIENIAINTVIPFLFLYGRQKDNEEYSKKAIRFLEEINSEKNAIITKWEQAGIKAQNAFESQALLQLRAKYCNRKNCLNCTIGNKIIVTT